jgi:hypothetical protein
MKKTVKMEMRPFKTCQVCRFKKAYDMFYSQQLQSRLATIEQLEAKFIF